MCGVCALTALVHHDSWVFAGLRCKCTVAWARSLAPRCNQWCGVLSLCALRSLRVCIAVRVSVCVRARALILQSTLIIGLGIGFYFNWKLSLVILSFAPIMVIAGKVMKVRRPACHAVLALLWEA